MVKFYLNNTVNLHTLAPHIMPSNNQKWRSFRDHRFGDVNSRYVFRLYWPDIIITVSLSCHSKRAIFYSCQYTVSRKKGDTRLMAVTSLDIRRFSEIFHRQILWEICNNVIVKNPTTPYTSLLCLVKLNVSKTTDVVINDKSQGSVATRLRCVVKFSIIIILPIFVAEFASEKLFKSVNI